MYPLTAGNYQNLETEEENKFLRDLQANDDQTQQTHQLLYDKQ
jgi:hypothetical protein